MSNGTNADDNIKCLPEGDSHSVTTIKLDERLEPGNNELIWFPNARFRPLREKSRTTCAFPASLRRLGEYSSFLIKAWIDMENTLSNGNPETGRVHARQRSLYGKQKLSFESCYLQTSLTVMHIVGRCLDLRVTLTKKWLAWCKCDHAWPFPDCWQPVTCTLLRAMSWGRAHGQVMSQRSWWSPDVSDRPAKLHSRSASLHSSLIWSDWLCDLALHTHQWCWGVSGRCDADDGCQLLRFSVYLGPHDSLFFLNDPIFCLTVRCVLLLALHLCEKSRLYATWKDRMTLLKLENSLPKVHQKILQLIGWNWTFFR